MADPKIAIIGTGNVGSALGERLTESGYAVRFGIREGGDASKAIARSGGRADASALREAASWADVIFVAVPGPAAVDAVKSLGSLDGKVVIDCTNAIKRGEGMAWAPPAEGSNTAAMAAAAPGAKLVKGWNAFGAEIHADPSGFGGPADVLLAGDTDGKAVATKIAERAGFRPIDAGPLRNAALLENAAILWIHLAMVSGLGRNMAMRFVARES